jgi:hypothetical protein
MSRYEAVQQLNQIVSEAFKRRRAMGLVGYQRRWVTVEQAADQAKKRMQRRIVIRREVVSLIGILGAASALILVALILLAY